MSEKKVTRKIVLLGDYAVGKSSIVYREINKRFNNFTESTIGSAYFVYKKIVKDFDSQNICLNIQIWDTAGAERYESLTPIYYRSADLIILVYDVTSPNCFESVNKWLRRLSESVENIEIVIVGNKIDLEKHIKCKKITELAMNLNYKHFFTSSKTNENITELFEYVTKYLVDTYEEKHIVKPRIIPDVDDNQYSLCNC
jgi:small GTP-binding protein